MKTKEDIRKKIHDYVDLADDRMLRVLSAVITADEEMQPSVPDLYYDELDKDRESHLNGTSPSYSWEDVKTRLIRTHGL